MLRALFVLLAVVSIVLAIVLAMPELYVAAGVLVVIAIVMLAASARRRHRKATQPFTATADRGADGELAALGISEIRPREKKRDEADLDVVAEPDLNEGENAPGSHGARTRQVSSTLEPGEAAGAASRLEAPGRGGSGQKQADELRALGIMEIRPRTGGPMSAEAAGVPENPSPATANGRDKMAASDQKPLKKRGAPATDDEITARDKLRREVLVPYLQAMQAAIGANTVCLLRQDDAALKYHIEAIVSKNAYARSQGHFSVRVPLLTPAASQRAVVTFRIGEKGIAGSNLGYYMEPIAVRQVAVADVPQQSYTSSYFVLADSMEEGGVGRAQQQVLLAQFARGLGTVLDGGEESTVADGTELRPRRDIIEEEMKRARQEERPLALVLVYLNRAEELAAEGIESVNEAEAILEGKLREAVEERRVEHFGELIYAVFFEGEVRSVEPWVMALQERLHETSGPLEGGVSIGIAVLGARHESPEAFRHDATEALREAYETGACTILE